jgi:hypothetical protein
LRTIVETWPGLSEAVKDAILTTISHSKQRNPQRDGLAQKELPE